MPKDILDTLRLLRLSLVRATAAAFAESGVGPMQFAVLRELRRGGGRPQGELARATTTDPASMKRAIEALERRGWVLRAGAPADRRSKIVTLTATGRGALRELDVAFDALHAVADAALTSREREQFCATGAKLTAAMDAFLAAVPAQGHPRTDRARVARRRKERR